MLTSLNSTLFRENPKIKPTFLENAVVTLTKDYTAEDPFCNRELIDGAVGTVIASGLSVYGYDPKTDDYSKLIDGSEWCFIELVSEIDLSDGYVRAKDLRKVIQTRM